jgi:hypothetical protein
MIGILEKKLKPRNLRVPLRITAPSREERGNPATNTFDTLWGHYCGVFCRPPKFFGQQENST